MNKKMTERGQPLRRLLLLFQQETVRVLLEHWEQEEYGRKSRWQQPGVVTHQAHEERKEKNPM